MNYLNKYPRIAVFFLGALSNLALAPFEFLPVLLVTFPLFLKVLNLKLATHKPFWLGWWFGFGYFVFGLYWISNSLLVDAERFAWMIPFAVSLIPAVLAVYIGLVAHVYSKYAAKLSQTKQVLFFIALWVVAEVARNYLFTGFPWNLIGYASLGFLPLAQFASVVTVFGMSALVLLLAFLPVLWGHKKSFYLAALLLINVAFYGLLPVMFADEKESELSLNIRLVQPNIEQKLRWDGDLLEQNFQKTLELAKQGDKDKFDIIVLPEAAVPYHVNRNPRARRLLGQAAPKDGYVITGALRSEGNPQNGDFKVWNSLYVINSKAEIVATYDKHHLVPFGEYVPFRDILPIDKITPGAVNFSSGENVASLPLEIGGKKFSFNPLICYEIIFPQYGYSTEGFDFIVNSTNDGWFGASSGPYQHLAMTRMRAIEQGKPVLRVANTGVSAIISASGKVLESRDLDTEGVIDSFSF